MTAPATIILGGPVSRQRAVEWVRKAPDGSMVAFHGPRRTLPQNDLLHVLATAVATQVDWPIGSGKKRDIEAWKDIFTAALLSAKHELDVVPGIEGGFVLLGMHTSQMKKAEMGELIELIYAFGANHGLTFSELADV